MGKTSIEWTGETWNPTRGCRRISPGCGRAKGQGGCYAERLAIRMSGPGGAYEGLVESTAQGPRWTGKGRLDVATLAGPLSWRTPRTVFVNSMSDLFFEEFTNLEIGAVFGVMAACPQHTFQVLTKRAKRMREWFDWMAAYGREADAAVQRFAISMLGEGVRFPLHAIKGTIKQFPWPLTNVHVGVSVENQKYADERIPELIATPAAIRFVSYEPALGPVDFTRYLTTKEPITRFEAFTPEARQAYPVAPSLLVRRGIDWIICGAESGSGAFPFDEAWARSVRDQCAKAGADFLYKQKLDARGRKISLPMLDGVVHHARPTPARVTT